MPINAGVVQDRDGAPRIIPMRWLEVSRRGLSSVHVMYREPLSRVVLSDNSSEEDKLSDEESGQEANENRIIAHNAWELMNQRIVIFTCSHLQ